MLKSNYFDIDINKYFSSIIRDKTVFNNYVEYQAELFGVQPEQLISILDAKTSELLDISSFAIRISHVNLSKVLSGGYFLNQYESKSSDGGIYTPSYRRKIEHDVLNIPTLLADTDRPVYGMCIPNNENVVEYIENGPGFFLGANEGCLVVLKNTIIPFATFTLGDSLANCDCLKCAPLSHPFFNGIYPDFYDKFNSIEELKNASLEDIFDTDNNYLELQIHGKSNHSIDIIDYVVFTKKPGIELLSKLNSLSIHYVIAPTEEHIREMTVISNRCR